MSTDEARNEEVAFDVAMFGSPITVDRMKELLGLSDVTEGR